MLHTCLYNRLMTILLLYVIRKACICLYLSETDKKLYLIVFSIPYSVVKSQFYAKFTTNNWCIVTQSKSSKEKICNKLINWHEIKYESIIHNMFTYFFFELYWNIKV